MRTYNIRQIKNLFRANKKADQFGYQGDLSTTIRIWSQYSTSWDQRLPPWRPSHGDISIYEECGGEKLGGNVLLLGATPELRDLVARYGGKLFLSDFSPTMISSMKMFMEHADLASESHIVGDWCNTLFPERFFDLVLGDFVWWLLSVERQRRLRDKIYNALADDGRFITRVHYYDPNVLNQITAEQVIQAHIRLLENGQSENLVMEKMFAQLVDVSTDAEFQRLDIPKIAPSFQYFLDSDSISTNSKAFLTKALARWIKRAEWTSQTKEQIVQCLEEKFILASKISAIDYQEAPLFPILTLRKLMALEFETNSENLPSNIA